MRTIWLNAGLHLWHLMRQLARRHEITYLGLADPDATEAERFGTLDVCRRLETMPRRDAAKGSLSFYLGAAQYHVHRLPYAEAWRRCASQVRIQLGVLTENLDAIRERLLGALIGAVSPIDTAGHGSAGRGMPRLSAYLRWKGAADGRAPAVLRES